MRAMVAVSLRLAACLLLGCFWLGSVLSFNLEPRIPIVKEGSPLSHFGYTVAQHQSIVETISGGESRKSWILVGAPKDHNLQPGTNRSGALWKCPLTSLTSDCEQVHTDGFRNPETRLYNFDYVDDDTLSEPVEDEIKDGQWLGVTLKSQGPGGKVLVCAHRYMHKGPKFQWGYGLCYILTNTLDVMDSLEPCRGKPVSAGYQQYGFCQAGTSGLLLEDEVVLGVPGPFTWRGTVHTSNISDNFLLKDKTQYFGPVTDTDSPVDKFSYLGYSVTAGRFFGPDVSYVGGAPRSQETGEVVFFSREKIGNSLLRVDLILSGEMFASSFGYEILALDINNDERDDLVVGAPFYYSRSASGAIYVYMNDDGGFQENHPFTKIEGAPGESRFGSSMTSLGDLNHDGYLDVAVGAPYEGRGAVYIFLGSRDGLVTEPAQVIRAEDLPGTPYNAFGYSLSGGMDLDSNGYPDLLTSSFCSDRVVLLRARPIIDIETKVSSDGQLNNIDPTRSGCREDITSPETCFSFDACFKMDSTAGTRTGLRLRYTIEERLYQDRPLARVRFADSSPNQPNEVHRNINLRPDDMGIFQCSREVVYLLEGSRDILRPLRFKLTYEIIQKEPRPVPEGAPLPDINEYPILNQKGALRYFEGTFAKECGNDDICMSDLHVTGSLELEHDATRKHYLLKLGEQDTVPLVVEVTNSKEPAYEASLLVNHDKALTFDPIESEVGVYQCSPTAPGVVKCGLGNPLINTTGPLKLNFKESGNIFDSRFIYFSVQANSSSTELTPQDPLHFQVEVIKRAEISIIGSVTPEQVFYGGDVVGESAIKHFNEIGMEVTHKYVVDNRGPWRVDDLQVEVLWPYQVENGKEKGKWLLYMTEHPVVDGVGECEIDPSYVNPLNLRRSSIYPDTFTGHEVEIEGETDVQPSPEEPDGTGDVVTGSGVKITKTTTTKKVTNTTIKKTTTKTSSEKEYSTTRGSSSSSSSSSTSSSSSHLDYDHDGGNIEGSDHDSESGRMHGRTHSRVSRKVYTTSDRSRFEENDLEGETAEGNEDKDGRVISHYEKTHHSSGASPDGKSTFTETRHESRKVTSGKSTDTEHVPSSRWGHGGGYRRTYTESSSSSDRTFDGKPEETHTRWETRRTYPAAGQDSEDQWGAAKSSDTHGRREESWREHSRTQTYDSTTRRTQSSGFGDDDYRRTHEGGAVTRTFGRDPYSTEDDRRTRARGQDGADERERFVWSDQTERTPHGRETGGRSREGNYYREQVHTSEATESRGGEPSPVTDTDRHGSRRAESDSRWSHTRYEGRSSSRQGYDDRLGGGQDYYRSSQGGHDDRSSSGQGYRGYHGSYDEGELTRTYLSDYDGARGRDDDRGQQSEDTSRRRSEGDRQHRPDHDSERHEYGSTYRGHDTNSDGAYRGSHGAYEDSHSDSERRRSYSESRSSTWHSQSSSGHNNQGRLQHFNHSNSDRHWAGASSGQHSTHIESDGSIVNGTYTRVEVDPKTGKTTTYTSKVVYNNWPTDHERSQAHEDSTSLPGDELESSGNYHRRTRTKREQELIIKPQMVTDEKTGKAMQVVHLRCDTPATAKCFVFRCNIRNLGARRTASIHIKSRLWNATLVEDYPRVSYVSIKSRASLILPDDIREDQLQDDDVDSAETLAYPDLLDQLPPEEVPLWVILVSIFAGLLVLIIIVLILWKLGFFERKRPDPTLSGNLDKDANGY